MRCLRAYWAPGFQGDGGLKPYLSTGVSHGLLPSEERFIHATTGQRKRSQDARSARFTSARLRASTGAGGDLLVVGTGSLISYCIPRKMVAKRPKQGTYHRSSTETTYPV